MVIKVGGNRVSITVCESFSGDTKTATMNFLTDNYHHRTEFQHEALKEALSKVPTVDAEPVVRCKDCVYWDSTEKVCVDMMTADEDGYCSWGERRKDGKNDCL